MKVSIIVPIYDVEKYIERCVISLFEQDFDNIEYVFVDDESPDNSIEILQQTVKKYPNRKPHIKIIHHEKNKGLGAARKTGLENATGEYVIHIDSDDWCESNMVSELYKKAKETDADIVACDYYRNYPNRQEYVRQDYLNKSKDNVLKLIEGELAPFVWNKLIKKDLYAKNKVYPQEQISMLEDRWLMTRLFFFAKKITYIPKAFSHYWKGNPNSICKNINNKTWEDILWYVDSTKQFLKEQGVYKQYKDSFLTYNLNFVFRFNNNLDTHKELVNFISPESRKIKYLRRTKYWKTKLNWIKKIELILYFLNLDFLINPGRMIRRNILTIKFIVKRTIQFLILGLSHLIPRKKTIWIFGGHLGLFDDNTKYLFIHTVENNPKIRAIWISKNKNTVDYLKNKNFEVYYRYSLKGWYYVLRGKYYIFHSGLFDISLSASGGTTKVNLWHGAPIKRIRFSTTKNGKIAPLFIPTLKNKFLYPHFYINSDFILSTSKRVTKYFAEAFRVKENQCLEFGYPRNEILSYSKDKIMEFVEKYEPIETKKLINKLKSYKKVFIYMPTWRDDGRNFIKKSDINFEILNTILENKNYLLLLKLHRYTWLPVNLHQYENIILIDNQLDIYPILPFTDCLITDYSSIYFDYYLMDKEVILFPFDKEEYINKDREMYFDYDEVLAKELVVNNFEELVDVIKSGAKSTGVKNNLLQEMILETKGIESSKEIVKIIENL